MSDFAIPQELLDVYPSPLPRTVLVPAACQAVLVSDELVGELMASPSRPVRLQIRADRHTGFLEFVCTRADE